MHVIIQERSCSEELSMKMWRSISVVLLGALCLVECQTPSVTTVAPTPTKSSSSMKMKPTVHPSPTPIPLPPGVSHYTYVLNDVTNKSLPCLRMQVDVALNFTFVNTTNFTRSLWIRFHNTSANDSIVTVDKEASVCNGTVNSPFATLTLKYVTKEHVEPYYVSFSFKGDRTRGNQQWNFDKLSVKFTYLSSLFLENEDKLGDNKVYMLDTNTSLFDDTNSRVELTRPYVCLANQTIRGFTVLGNDTTVGVWVRELEVQAFEFLTNNGTFSGGNAPRVCLLDHTNTGNEVVPIAVGAALGVLVAIVLLAYLLGKLRNRRKSSYEALN
ncbi:LAMP family protein lmp-1-like isoform X2 [Halichondria panicea]|uniref:LAMP family protein lmp-1-like isoform X2 n=1 Tax=Halichondria panicea TaxID=6063 RepID=UPI00312B91EB